MEWCPAWRPLSGVAKCYWEVALLDCICARVFICAKNLKLCRAGVNIASCQKGHFRLLAKSHPLHRGIDPPHDEGRLAKHPREGESADDEAKIPLAGPIENSGRAHHPLGKVSKARYLARLANKTRQPCSFEAKHDAAMIQACFTCWTLLLCCPNCLPV